MGEVTYIIVSEDVFEDPNAGRIIVKPFSTLFLPNIPNNFSFAISFGIVDLRYNESHQVSIKIISPDNKVLIEQTFDHRVNNDDKDPDTIVTTDLTMNCRNFLFTEKGHYKISIGLNGKEKSLIFPVYESQDKIQKNG